MSRRLTLAPLALCLLLLLAGAVPAAWSAGAVPPNFADTPVVNVSAPTALAFTPDGRMLVTSQSGQLHVYQGGALNTALDLGAQICANNERGLLGIAVDPQFASNRFVYLYYTFKKFPQAAVPCPFHEPLNPDNPVNRVARFVLPDSNVVSPAGEVVLIDNIPSPRGNHNAGDLHFGQDGYLYISIGDGGCDLDDNCFVGNPAARHLYELSGKILRITRDGGIPPNNPFVAGNSARCNTTARTDPDKTCQEIYAFGLRNPFRMAFDPNAAGTRFFINDVGENTWEEIDEGLAGADYGWSTREGFCAPGSTSNCGAPPAGMSNPIYAYGRDTGCKSITGGAFVPGGAWPPEYDGAYLFADYVCGKIFKLTPNGSGGYSAAEFVTGLGNSSIVAMAFGPYEATQALYYATHAGTDQIRVIAYTGSSNRAPSAALTADPHFGAPPLAVTFDAGASADPDAGDTLTYLWDFGDQGAPSETSASTTAHTYPDTGVYTATVRVRDNHGAVSAAATARIDVGNSPPTPLIDAPTADLRFRVGQAIVLRGHAADAEDGDDVPDSQLTWVLTLHHNDHTHPFLTATGNNIAITAPAPEDLPAADNSYVAIELTARDSLGAPGVITGTLRPHKVDLTFASAPSGLGLEINAAPISTPKKLVSWEGFQVHVAAPAQQHLRFLGWSDGGAATHTITTPAAAATYTATYTLNHTLFLPMVIR